ncbi:MAG: hypothetical protein IPF85_03105 [Anaerolineae bacterium]|nr:hypothetical protein [Anaerolineae bacterium]
MLNDILNLPQYPSSKRLFIVDMMRKFEDCATTSRPNQTLLVPDLLPKDEPYTGESGPARSPSSTASRRVLPTSIMSRFIVRMNTFIFKTVTAFWRGTQAGREHRSRQSRHRRS